ncbi:hypothetical protein KVV02_001842 [Mortierella alpina]|uniref:C2H2-type domain-containing protein n=1 Tax=Mortierella alpina TaxID=64518 RepID=A0A9P8A593_MORAP|nr:hypothetical protein KVV02_001842 [Mortierella alpina]
MTQQSSCLEFRGYGSIIFVHYGRRPATANAHSCSHSHPKGTAKALGDHPSDRDKHTHAQRPHAQPARDHFHHETHSTSALHTSPYTHQNHGRNPMEHPYGVHQNHHNHNSSNSNNNNNNNNNNHYHYHHQHQHSHYTDSYNDSSDSGRNSYSPEPEPESRSDAQLSTRSSPMFIDGLPTHVPESHRYDAAHPDPKTLSPADGHLKWEGAPEDSAVSAPQANGSEDEDDHLLPRLSTIEEESLQKQARAYRNPTREPSPPITTRIIDGTGPIAPSERDAPPPQTTRALSSVSPSEGPLSRTPLGPNAAVADSSMTLTQSPSSALSNPSSPASSPPLPLQKRPRSPSQEREISPASPRAKCSPSNGLSPQTSCESSDRPSLSQPDRINAWPAENHSPRRLASPLPTPHAHGPPPVVKKQRRRRISSEEEARILVNGVSRFVCHECNRYFTRANNLKMHRLTHAGTKPYLCNFEDGAGDPCPSAFTRKHDLQRHVDSVHLMATKFKCSYCGVECKRQDGFRRHQLSNPRCRMANNMAQVLRRRDETTAEAEMREEAEDMDELESSEADESSEEDAAKVDRIEQSAVQLDADGAEVRPGFRPGDRWTWNFERPVTQHRP